MQLLFSLICIAIVSLCQTNFAVVSNDHRNDDWVEEARLVVSDVVEGKVTNAVSSLQDLIPRKASKQYINRVFREFKQQPHLDVASGVGLEEYRNAFYRVSYSSSGHVFTVDFLANGEYEGDDVYCGFVEYHYRGRGRGNGLGNRSPRSTFESDAE